MVRSQLHDLYYILADVAAFDDATNEKRLEARACPVVLAQKRRIGDYLMFQETLH